MLICLAFFYTEPRQSISFSDALFRFRVHIHQPNTYILVARLREELIWRKVCVPLKERTQYRDNVFCNRNLPVDLDLHNVSASEVWLARGMKTDVYASYPEIFLHNVVEGNCSQFGGSLLSFRCFNTGMSVPIHRS